MKRIVMAVLSVCLLTACLFLTSNEAQAATTASGTCGTNLTWTLDDTGTLTISGSGFMTDYTYSSKAPWYSYRSSITGVVLTDGIYSVGNYAFYNHTAIATVDLPDSLCELGNSSFYGCSALSQIILPDVLNTLGTYAFYKCTALSSVTVPNSVTTIPSYCFYGCTSMADISLPYWLESIGSAAFRNCTALKRIAIPECVTTISVNAFYGCSNLKQVFFTAEAPTFGNSVFGGVTANVYYPDDVDYGWTTDLRQNYGGTLTWIAAEPGTTAAGTCGGMGWAFIGYSGELKITGTGAMHTHKANYSCFSSIADEIRTVKLSDEITTVSDYAFYGCDNLYTVHVPDSITTVGKYAFACSGLCSIVLPDGCTQVDNYAFMNCSHLDFIKLPDSVTYIGSYAFYGCSALKSITLPKGETHIMQRTFANSGLESIRIPQNIGVISTLAFESCADLEMMVFEGKAPNFSLDCFSMSSPTIYYPDNEPTWTEDVRWSYYGTPTWKPMTDGVVASGLNYSYGKLQWTLDNTGVLTLSGDAYRMPDYNGVNPPWYPYRGVIETVVITAPVNTIGSYAFGWLDQMTAVQLPTRDCSSFTINRSAFTSCRSLESVFISNGKESGCTIGDYAFNYCISLKEVGFPSGAVIGESAFGYCERLESVYIVAGNSFYNMDIHADAFETANARVYYPTGYAPGSKAQSYGGKLTWTEANFGMCGTDVKWSFDSTSGTLTLTGSGVPAQYWSGNYTPWNYLNTKIQKIVISNGITELPSYLFEYVTAAKTVDLPETLTMLAANAFNDCESLNNILLPSSLTGFSDWYTFNRCKALTDIYYLGTAQNWAKITNAGSVTNGYNVHVLQWKESTATCTQAGAEAHYGFDNTEIYSHKYDANWNPLTELATVPALGHSYQTGVCDRCKDMLYHIAVFENGEPIASYSDFYNAVKACSIGSQYIRLFADIQTNTMLPKDLYIDLNGHTFEGTLDTNDHKVYGMDSTTDGYTCESIGYFNCQDMDGNVVVPVSNVKTDVTGSIKRYVTLPTESGYTFHRYYMGVTHMSLKAGTQGVGYKAVFAGDPMVLAAVDSFGYSLQLGSYAPFAAVQDGSKLVSGKTVSLRIDGFQVEDYGEADLTAQVFLTVNGETLFSTGYATTLKDLVQAVDSNPGDYTEKQLAQLKQWLSQYEITKDWNLSNLI